MLIDQLGRAVEGGAADRDLSAGILKDRHPKAKDLSSAAAKDHRQLSKARVIDTEEVVCLWDERERKDNDKAVRAAAREEKKKQGIIKELVLRTKSKGRKLKLSAWRKSWKSFTCLRLMLMKLWMRRRVILQG